MTHDELKKLLPWYASQTLATGEQEAVEGHVQACPECARELAALRRLVETSQWLKDSEPEPSPVLLDRTLQKINDYEHKKAVPRHWRISLSLAASFVVASMLGILLFSGDGTTHPAPYFSTGGNPYHAEIVLDLFMAEQLDVFGAMNLLYFP